MTKFTPCILAILLLVLLAPLGAQQANAPSEKKPKQGANVDSDNIPLPSGAILRLGTTRLNQLNPIYSLCFTPDDKHVISAGDGPACVWDAATGKRVRAFGDSQCNHICKACLSPDGKRLAVGGQGEKHAGAIFEFLTGKVLGRFGDPISLLTPCFSPDGKMLAVSYGGSEFQLIDGANGSVIRTLRTAAGITKLLFMPNGKILISADRDGLPYAKRPPPSLVRFWDVDTGKNMRSIEMHPDGTAVMALSLDGSRLATVAYDLTPTEKNGWTMTRAGAVLIWDTATCKKLHTITVAKPKEGPTLVAFTKDGKGLLVGGGDSIVSLWDIASGKKKRDILRTGPAWLFSMALSHDGETLAVGTNEGTVSLHSLATGKPLVSTHGHRARVMSISASADGKYIATAGADGLVCLWDRGSGRELRRWADHEGIVWRVAFSPDSKSFLSSANDSVLRQRDPATGKSKVLLEEFGHPVFAADAKTIALTGRGDVLLLDTQTMKNQELKGPGRSTVAAFTPDSNALFSWSPSNEVHIWDLNTRTHREQRLESHARNRWTTAAFSADCKLIALDSEGFIPVIEVASGKERCRFAIASASKEFGEVSALAFSADKRYLAWGGRSSGIIRIGDIATGKELNRFDCAGGGVNCLAFSGDGKTLYSGADDTTALIWDLRVLRDRDE